MLRLKVLSPERPFLDEECVSVTLPGTMGEMQILSGHAALLAELSAGIVICDKGKEQLRFMIAEGIVEVVNDQVHVLCEQARLKSEVNKGVEEALLTEIKSKFAKACDDHEQRLMNAELARCTARLNLLE